ncbi:hypothetical protein CL618_00595 [archaeon]|nr:hypothetical protein [archaeon]|tara:strand:+ start:7528 stop:8013 length:486 start_codon:yes stop_codon:yes gene_type:complete
MVNKVCADTGPILHLQEINKVKLLKIFKKIFISKYVKEELSKYKIEKLPKNFELEKINKNQVALITTKYNLDIGESSIIWLCKSLNIPLILTDDLDAREIAKHLDLKPIGTIGIIVRCFREKIINQKESIKILKEIYDESSLFVTSELINYAVSEIKKFSR